MIAPYLAAGFLVALVIAIRTALKIRADNLTLVRRNESLRAELPGPYLARCVVEARRRVAGLDDIREALA